MLSDASDLSLPRLFDDLRKWGFENVTPTFQCPEGPHAATNSNDLIVTSITKAEGFEKSSMCRIANNLRTIGTPIADRITKRERVFTMPPAGREGLNAFVLLFGWLKLAVTQSTISNTLLYKNKHKETAPGGAQTACKPVAISARSAKSLGREMVALSKVIVSRLQEKCAHLRWTLAHICFARRRASLRPTALGDDSVR